MHLSKFFAACKQPLFFLLTFLFLTLSFFFTPQAFAQYQDSSFLPATNPDVPMNLHTLTQSVTLDVVSSAICLLGGFDPMSKTHECLGYDTKTDRIGYVNSGGGLLGTSTMLVSYVITPPGIHTTDYLSYLGSNFGLVKKTYAAGKCNAGVGFCGITPILNIWTIFRNIVYIFFVILFILVGFAIMLRYKIDPRTVMTIENQLPKLIVALIMVTFSFALAGIMIDTMWVSSFVVVNILTAADTQNPIKAQDVNNNFFQNPLGFSNNVLPGGILGVSAGAGGSMGDIVKGILTPNNSDKLGLTPHTTTDCENTTVFFGFFGTAFCNLGQTIGDAVAGTIGYLVSWIVSVLAILIVLIAVIIAMFRLWFTLLLAYGYILIDVLLGPFMIMFGVFPGSKIGFGSWMRDMLSNLVAFPVAIVMFLLARLLMDAFAPNNGTATLFVPPLIGNPNGTADPASTGNPIGWFIGVAVILMTPQVVAMMKDLFKAPQFKYSQAIFQGLGSAGSIFGGALKETAAGVIAKRFGALPQGKESHILTALRRWIR